VAAGAVRFDLNQLLFSFPQSTLKQKEKKQYPNSALIRHFFACSTPVGEDQGPHFNAASRRMIRWRIFMLKGRVGGIW
jgi:hypothetical protein